MATQQVLFTVLPRAMAVNSATLPVSVFIAPRLSGAGRLDAFPDWLRWTARVADGGLRITLKCATQSQSFDVDRAPLRPDLWEALFEPDTFVRAHEFEDYTDRGLLSFPARAALSVLKSTYQAAGLALALPERASPFAGRDDERGHRRRAVLRALLDGLAINWNEDKGERWRTVLRAANSAGTFAGAEARFPAQSLAADGTFAVPPPGSGMDAAQLRRAVAQQYGAYSHLPQGQPLKDRPQDFPTLIDFHQALSSLNSYPELLRALGLVFDLELPLDLVPTTAPGAYGTMAVVDVPGFAWAIATTTVPAAPAVSTAYLHWHTASPSFRLFTTAPAVMQATGASLDLFGLLLLDPERHGLAQVDLDSGLQKTTLLAEAWQPGRPSPAPPDRPDVFDETTTLPSLRSGGFSIFADGRALRLSRSFQRQKDLNAGLTSGSSTARPLFAEDVAQGYRVDVWDGFTGKWHSLHRRHAHFDINGVAFDVPGATEGFAQLAAAQPAPGAPASSAKDLYLNESMARWAGWSLSVPFPGKTLSHEADPAKALDPAALASQNDAATPFKIQPKFGIAAGTLPSLRFGRRYRFRMRAVDLAGNSLRHDDPVADFLGLVAGLPRDAEGLPYLRFEPIDAPAVVLRDAASVTAPGSQLERLVIRTFNDDASKDDQSAVLDAGDRHIVPPSTSVEMGERLGMFDDNGKPNASAAMYALIAARDKGRLPESTFNVAGKSQAFPLVSGARIDALPYLPDVLSRGAALRDLPGAPDRAIGHVAPGAGAEAAVVYQPLAAANARPGSATLVSFGAGDDWQKMQPFRLALEDGDAVPRWDPAERVLKVSLPKGTTSTVLLSSVLQADDLKRMGVWQWLREAVDSYAVTNRQIALADARVDSEMVAHILQRAQEGGHWMLTPPRVLTLVHAVQQPLGIPRFTAIAVQRRPYGRPRHAGGEPDERLGADPAVLQTTPEGTPTAMTELAPITAWRRLDSTDAFLLGALEIHAASTDRVELLAKWIDPYDDADKPRKASDPAEHWSIEVQAPVDEVPVPSTLEGTIYVAPGTPQARAVAYLDADHGLLCFARAGDRLGNLMSGGIVYQDSAPRHRLGDTRHHRIAYTARATSRFREYFDPQAELDFTRTSAPVTVDVPASARPSPPQVSYVVPTFGWQRQLDSNIKRSVRFGGGLRIFLERPWFSSGEGELLGVALYDWFNGSFDTAARERWKAHVTQWGADPIWVAARIDGVPGRNNLLNAVAAEASLSLPRPAPGHVDVAGYEVAFDDERQKWFADIAIDTGTLAYAPFVRLVLVRYQPCALPDAKLSAPIVADFIQLTPERAAVVSADPYHPRTLRVTVSGPAPTGPVPQVQARPAAAAARPSLVIVTVQQFDDAVGTDLGWRDAPALATVTAGASPPDDVLRWSGRVRFSRLPEPGQCRLLIREYEYLSANWTEDAATAIGTRSRQPPHRLIYAETVVVDAALIEPPSMPTGTTVSEEGPS